MENIQMVDLLGQYEKIKEQIDNSILEVVRSSKYINGPEVASFKQELEQYLNVKHVIPCANGTDALQIAMMALGLKPGDEVITANFTYVATVEVIGLLNLKPILVEADPKTFNINPDAIRNAITPRTKAIVPVHLYGQSANMEEVMKIAKEHNLFVIEDTAQAIGAKYTFSDGTTETVGAIGDFGTTSFFPSKNLGCYGDGGAIFTNNDELAVAAKMIANHGQSKQYYHDKVGVNSRLDSIQATVLRAKLPHLDTYIKNRNIAADFYDNAFSDVEWLETPFRDPKSTHVFHQYTLKTKGVDRDELRSFLSGKGVPAMIYYPVPLHHQKAYSDASLYKDSDFENTIDLCKSVISLPMHTELTEEELIYITKTVKEFK
ncbi:MAG: DegT/DnrJ/EryC1/StrS family aminotransferase [Flavobacteriales bacterium]|nr:DegT/DnrJ/EryC1/StrS family aminotransferase [Flavobacteriales bacterium]MDG1175882.1 DegT/DnrJ/EryC1/StrS family aminotransferase [Flavobacteriales bacterium]